MEIEYFESSNDYMWRNECAKLIPYLDGVGLDVCCGRRSIFPGDFRVDIDPKKEPDIVASAMDLPFADCQFDYVYGIHAFEHLSDPIKGLREWLRVTKPGGIIALVHPDVDYTKKQKPLSDNPSLQGDIFNKHFFEYNQKEFGKWIKGKEKFGFKVLDIGIAMDEWSFNVILRKNKGVSN